MRSRWGPAAGRHLPAPATLTATAAFVLLTGAGHTAAASTRVTGTVSCREWIAAASGAEYQVERTLFWSQGNEARIEVEGKAYPACTRRAG